MSTDLQRHISSLTASLDQATHTLREKVDELSLARRVGDAISQHTSIWSLSCELVDPIAATINCKYVLLYTAKDAGAFDLQAVSTVFSGFERFPVTLRDPRITTHLEQTRRPIQIADIASDKQWRDKWPFPVNLASWLVLPLFARDRLRGILCLADETPAAFDDGTLRPIEILVPQISSALSNIALYDRLRESETKYRNLVVRMQDVVYICNRAWEVVDANPAADVLFGGPIVGKCLTELFTSPNAASEFVEAVRTSSVVQNFETQLLTSSNQSAVVLMSCTSDGEGYSGIIKDVTERSRLFDQITRAQKMESIGRVAAAAAHDFNNILAVIIPTADLIKTHAEAPPAVVGYADLIFAALHGASNLTKQLLSLSRTDPVFLRSMNLNDAVQAAGKLIGEILHRGIRLQVDLAAETPYIRGDENQIQQVLLNLAMNARDAMPDGGQLQFKTWQDGDKVILQVEDSGTGIDAEILPKIFDPFFTTKDKSNGTGLGLSIVYRIVKQSGGTIDVKSEPDRGTKFTLTFPSSDDSRRRTQPRAAKVAGGSEKILIADDEPEILKLLERCFADLGYSVVSARNGVEAVEQAKGDIDLVILDMVMPEMDGLAALRNIRERTPDVKVVVTSGYTSPEKTPLLNAMGIQRFVPKPFEIAKLAGTVRDVLDGLAV